MSKLDKRDARNCAGTPQHLVDQWVKEYRLNIDAAASRENAKLKRFWTEADDALLLSWNRERPFCNPPYNKPGQKILRWIQHALAERPAVAVFLLPNSTGAEWFRLAWEHGEIHFFDGRINYIPPSGVIYSTNDRDSCLIILGREAKPRTVRFRSAETGKLL